MADSVRVPRIQKKHVAARADKRLYTTCIYHVTIVKILRCLAPLKTLLWSQKTDPNVSDSFSLQFVNKFSYIPI